MQYWVSIEDMILSNWFKCIDGDLRYSRKVVDLDSEVTEEDVEQWYRIYDTHIARFGFNPKYERILKAMKKKAILELKYVMTRDPFLKTLIAIEREKIATLRKERSGGNDGHSVLVRLSKWYGQMLRATEITVLEFHLIREEYGKANK